MGIGASHYFLLDRRAGWRAAALDRTRLKHDGACLQLQKLPGPARPLVDAAGDFGGLVHPVGLAVDEVGNIYILDGGADLVKRFNPCTLTFEVLPCIGGSGHEPRQVRQPQSIAISCGNLYLADTGNRRVQVFSLKGLSLRDIWGPLKVVRQGTEMAIEPARGGRPPASTSGECETSPAFPDGTWQPWDVVLSRDGWAYVSDYANGLVHLFDPSGRWLKAFGGGANQPSLEKPTRLALDRECNLYIVQDGKTEVTILDAQGTFKGAVADAQSLHGKFCPTQLVVDESGNLYIGDKLERCVRVYCPNPHGGYQYAGTCQGIEGVGLALAFDKTGNLLACDPKKPRVVCFAPPPTFPMQGTFLSNELDSHIYRCPWHRVLLCADIPAGTQVRVDTFTSESAKPTTEVQNLPPERWAIGILDSQMGEGEWDCLVLSPPGRYLWLRLTLLGDGTATPSVQWSRVYFPRASSLQYLPATFSADPQSRDFLDRFLSIFDTMVASLSDQITMVARLFDPRATPAGATKPGEVDFLTWLAGWLGLTLERQWPVDKRRELVQQAYRLYQLRGTPEGLRLHLKLFLGVEPQVLEHFNLRRWLFLGGARLGDQTKLWGREVVQRLQLDGRAQIGSFQLVDTGDPLRDPFYAYAHQFSVFVPMHREPTEAEKQTLSRIVEMAKPADTQARIEYVQPRFRIGLQSFIGVDTIVGEYPSGITTDRGRLGYDTVLGPSPDEAEPPRMRIGKSTRIGSSTLFS